MQGKTIGVGKTDCFEITSFEIIEKPTFQIGETVMIEEDSSFDWIEGVVKDIEVDSSNSCYYIIEDKNGEIHQYVWEDSIKSV